MTILSLAITGMFPLTRQAEASEPGANRSHLPAPLGDIDVDAAEIKFPKPGSPERVAILNCLRALPFVAEIAKEQGEGILFENVAIRYSGTWAWVTGSPMTKSETWRGEPITGLVKFVDGVWHVVDLLPEEVLTADDTGKAYTEWRHKLLKANPSCPPAVIPAQ